MNDLQNLAPRKYNPLYGSFFQYTHMYIIMLLLCIFKTQCRQDLDWYKEIKKIQGSVEVTSVNQVEDINQCGAYTICCDGRKMLQSIEGAVSLKIMRVKAARKVYSFDDLRDLESKLVLIRGTSTKGGAEIDRFLDVSATVTNITGFVYHNILYSRFFS